MPVISLTKRVEQLELRVMTKETDDDGCKGTKADQTSHGMKLPGVPEFCGDESDDIDALVGGCLNRNELPRFVNGLRKKS